MEFRWRRVETSYWLGDTLTEAGRSAEAVNVLQVAIAEGERMVATAPTEFAWRSDLADALITLGKAFSYQGRARRRGRPSHEGRARFWRRCEKPIPTTQTHLVNQARCIRFLGSVLHTLRRDDEAIRALSEAVHLLEETSEEARRRSNYIISNLAVIYGDLGELQHRTGRLADAQGTLEKADALGLRYTGQAGSPRLDPLWLVDSRTQFGPGSDGDGQARPGQGAVAPCRGTLRELPSPPQSFSRPGGGRLRPGRIG